MGFIAKKKGTNAAAIAALQDFAININALIKATQSPSYKDVYSKNVVNKQAVDEILNQVVGLLDITGETDPIYEIIGQIVSEEGKNQANFQVLFERVKEGISIQALQAVSKAANFCNAEIVQPKIRPGLHGKVKQLIAYPFVLKLCKNRIKNKDAGALTKIIDKILTSTLKDLKGEELITLHNAFNEAELKYNENIVEETYRRFAECIVQLRNVNPNHSRLQMLKTLLKLEDHEAMLLDVTHLVLKSYEQTLDIIAAEGLTQIMEKEILAALGTQKPLVDFAQLLMEFIEIHAEFKVYLQGHKGKDKINFIHPDDIVYELKLMLYQNDEGVDTSYGTLKELFEPASGEQTETIKNKMIARFNKSNLSSSTVQMASVEIRKTLNGMKAILQKPTQNYVIDFNKIYSEDDDSLASNSSSNHLSAASSNKTIEFN